MCGIAGYQSANPENRETIIRNMMDSIRHRGPDDEGTYFDGNVAFGHVRLSIIDITYGQQPITTTDGNYTVVFNGEIYNYLELRQQLTQKGYAFKTHSDSEVLLYMYVAYGKEMLNYLNGMFAFAIHDKKEQSLFMARDHFGIKPLYYYADQDQFVFASEIKALLQHPAVKAKVNQSALQEYLTFQFVLAEQTLFDGVHKLEPAQYMIVRGNKIVEKDSFWQMSYAIDENRNEETFADELLVLLDNAASIQIRSDVPIGAYLSGGIDSSIVATLAAKNYYGSFKTFTGGFKGSPGYDESEYAKILSDYIKSEHFTIFPDHNDFIDAFEKLVYHMDEPAAGPGLFPQYMVSKLASEHVKVVLGGQGGDEIFGGYTRYLVAYLEQCLKGSIFETQEEGQHVVTLASIIDNLPQMKQYIPMIKNQFASGLFEEMDKRYLRLIDRSPNLHKIYSDDCMAAREEQEIRERFGQVFNAPDTTSYFNKMTHFDAKTLLPALLQVEDRVSMAVSLESRVPLLDRRIIELACSMPPTIKFAGGKTKYMLIKAVRNILPKEILQRKDKMGFPTPLNEWMAGPLKDYTLGIFNDQRTKERGLFKVANIEKEINNSQKFSRDLWGALNLEIWHRQFMD